MSTPLVVLARIGSPHGVRGALSVNQAGEHLRHFLGKKIVVCTHPAAAQGIVTDYSTKAELILERVEPAKGEPARIQLAGITDRDRAASLTNFFLAAALTDLRAFAAEERGDRAVEFADLWYFEILGLEVIDAEAGVAIGKITSIEDMGLNTVVSVETNAGVQHGAFTFDIPLNYDHWQTVDLAKNQVQLGNWQIFSERG